MANTRPHFGRDINLFKKLQESQAVTQKTRITVKLLKIKYKRENLKNGQRKITQHIKRNTYIWMLTSNQKWWGRDSSDVTSLKCREGEGKKQKYHLIQNSISKKLPLKNKVDIFLDKRKPRDLISRLTLLSTFKKNFFYKIFFRMRGDDTNESLDFQKRKNKIGNGK